MKPAGFAALPVRFPARPGTWVTMSTDHELLARYRAGSAEAFAELAGRHVDWVYAACRRRVGDEHLAADVTQTVFAALAADGRAGREAAVAGWLFGVLRHTAARAVRDRARRRRHEAAAAVDPLATAGDDAAWADLAPLLEDAVGRLRAADRRAVLLRFYQRQTFAQVGAALGVSEDGARKRVGRAVDRLRRDFAARGVTAAEAALPGLLLGRCAEPAPAALAAAVGRPAAVVERRLGWPAAGVAAAVVGLGAAAVAVWRATAPAPAGVRPAVATRPSPGEEPATRPTAVTFDQIVAAVTRAEREFTDVHVQDFEATVSERTGEGPWAATPIRYAGSAWYGADPRGPQRVYFATHVMRWEHGAAPSIDQVLDLSGDTGWGLAMTLADETGGPWMRERRASLTAATPMLLDARTRYATGVGYTVQYGVQAEDSSVPVRPRRLLSDELRQITASPGVRVDLAEGRVNGFDTVRLRATFRAGHSSWWFAPDHGFAVVRQEQVLSRPGGVRIEGTDVYNLRRVGPGVWFPVRASRVEGVPGPRPGPSRRYDYRAAEVTVNDPAFDPAVLRPAVPSGWIVDDRRRQPPRLYVTMPGGAELDAHAITGMPDVPAAEDPRPDEPGPAVTRNPRAWW